MSEHSTPAQAARPLRVLVSFRTPSSTTNPYITQLYRSLKATAGIDVTTFSWRDALLRNWDVLHVHWPDTMWASPSRARRTLKQLLFGLLLVKNRVMKTSVLWTRHNPNPHENLDPLARFLVRGLTRQTSCYILLNGQIPDLRGKPYKVILHGHYVDWFARMPRSPRVPGRVACFGLIRAYKGMDELLSAFTVLDDAGASLAIAGRPVDAATAQRLSELAATDARVELTLRFLEEEEVVRLITESELMAFPYAEMNNSGAVLAALSLSRPVLVPRNAVTEALGREVGEEWVRLYDGSITRQVLEDALTAIRRLADGTGPDLSRRSWAKAGELHADAYRLAAKLRRR